MPELLESEKVNMQPEPLGWVAIAATVLLLLGGWFVLR